MKQQQEMTEVIYENLRPERNLLKQDIGENLVLLLFYVEVSDAGVCRGEKLDWISGKEKRLGAGLV